MWYIGSATPPVDQARPQPRAEQHADPREGRKIRFVAVFSKFHVAKPAEQEPKNEKQRQRHHENVEPVQRVDDEILALRKNFPGKFDILDCKSDEADNHDHRRDGHEGVHPSKNPGLCDQTLWRHMGFISHQKFLPEFCIVA
jgi:hypothetical protein